MTADRGAAGRACIVCGRTDEWPEIAIAEVWCPACGGPLPSFLAADVNQWVAFHAKRAP